MRTSDRPTAAIETGGPNETFRLGAALGKELSAGAMIGLSGELGSGKTIIIKGIADGMGVADVNRVVSPTFIFLKIHQGDVPLYHFDAYRISNAAAFSELGVEEYLAGSGVCVIEWSDKIAKALPAERLDIRLYHLGPRSRRIEFHPRGARYETLVETSLWAWSG